VTQHENIQLSTSTEIPLLLESTGLETALT